MSNSNCICKNVLIIFGLPCSFNLIYNLFLKNLFSTPASRWGMENQDILEKQKSKEILRKIE